jgi:hypothetical protein
VSNKIQVQRIAHFGTSEWRAVGNDGNPLFEIRLQLSSRLNGSHYFVLGPRGEVIHHGTFHFEVWDYAAMAQVLMAIVKTVAPDSEVDVEIEPLQRASGA